MSTSPLTLDSALAALPLDLRRRLIESYASLKAAYVDGQFDACGLRAGKACETIVRVLESHLTGTYTPFTEKIGNFSDACRRLEKLPKSAGSESMRIIIPRAIEFVYTLRNKRDIGHVGGDVDANQIDSSSAVRVVDWCLSELIRETHTLSLEEAQAILDSIAERQVPLVWATGGVKRVLDATLSHSEQTLLLLYNDPDTAIPVEDLATWVGVARVSNYRERVLRRLHSQRLVEFDVSTQMVMLSPTGVRSAEEILRLRGAA